MAILNSFTHNILEVIITQVSGMSQLQVLEHTNQHEIQRLAHPPGFCLVGAVRMHHAQSCQCVRVRNFACCCPWKGMPRLPALWVPLTPNAYSLLPHPCICHPPLTLSAHHSLPMATPRIYPHCVCCHPLALSTLSLSLGYLTPTPPSHVLINYCISTLCYKILY